MLNISLQEYRGIDLLDLTPVNIAIHDADNAIVWANKAYLQATGLTLSEITGKACYIAWGLPGLCRNCPVVEALATGEAQEGELSPENQEHWPETQGVWLSRATPLKDANGMVIGALETAYDITLQRRAEQALRDLNHYNRSLIEASLDPLVTIDAAGKISDVNPATTTITGFSRQALIGADFSNYFTDPEKARQGYQQVFKEGAVRDYPLEIRHQDGHTTPVLYNATVYRNQAGDIKGVFAAARDVSALMRSEKALRESEEKFRTVADFTYDWEAWWLPDGSYRYVSPSCRRISGHEPKDFLADPDLIFRITHPDDLESVRQHYQDADLVQKDQDLELVFRILAADGDVRWISHNCTPVYSADGRWLGRRESNRDITQRKLAQEEKDRLERRNRRLEKAASLERMAGAVAHHFNNKLHAVLGNLELAREDLSRGNVCSGYLNAAMTAADEAADVSRMMLVYIGQVSTERCPLDLASVCREGLSSLRAKLPKKAEIVADFPVSGPVVKASAKQIRQILANLVTNAWESSNTNHPNTITVTIRTVKSADIPEENRYPIDWQATADTYACLEVRDTGYGIAPESLQELFTPFYSTKFTGRGLGLPVALGLVQAHAGAITVESRQGQGTVLRVYMPLLEAETVGGSLATTGTANSSMPAGTVLLVDDDQIAVQVTSLMLARLGFTVLVAHDGVEAVDLFRRVREDVGLVITDVSMPRMNGWETLAALRQISPDIPVILASGYSEEQVMEGIHADLPQAFLGKPFNFEELRSTVERTLSGTAGTAGTVSGENR